MDIYSIQLTNSIVTSFDIEVIKRKAKRYAQQKKDAIIKQNGKKIGWVGRDLTKRKGWGWCI